MATPTVYVICDQNCKWEGMTKEQILTAITQAVKNGTIGDVDTGFVETIKTINGKPLRFFVGTQDQYEALGDSEKQNLFAIITNDTIKEDLLASIETLTIGFSNLENALANGDFVVNKASNAVIAEKDISGRNIVETYFRRIRDYKNNPDINGVSISAGVYLVNVKVKTPFTDSNTVNGVSASTILYYDGVNWVTSVLDTVTSADNVGMYRVKVQPQQDYTGNGLLTVQEAFITGEKNKSYADIEDGSLLSIECIKIANI